jgi:probable F420-dependent oxidoreductase
VTDERIDAGRLRAGLVTPVLTMLPGAHASWEERGTLEDVVEVVRAAERLGYDHVTCSEHVAIPIDVAQVRGGRYWDPLATFGHLAAHTSRIRLATFVLVLGYHHPLAIAKRYGTLDRVCNGRLVLGVGVGSLEEEFRLLEARFDDRGLRADDAMRALRAVFGQREPEYHGTYYDIDGMIVDPCGVQTDVPLWVGGRTARSLRRAVELGDAWAPFGLNAEAVGEMLARAEATLAWQARRTALEVWLQPSPLDPLAEPSPTVERLARLSAAGATGVSARFVHHSRAHYLEQIEALLPLLSPER